MLHVIDSFYRVGEMLSLNFRLARSSDRATRWDNLENKPWNSVERRSKVGHDKPLNLLEY
jgi:hypothetical protein